MVRIGVLASGSGTNFQALLDADLGGGEIAVLVVNKPSAGAIARAERAGVPVEVVPHRDFSDRAAFDARLVEVLGGYDVDWIVLAGFMRVLTPTFLGAFPSRIVNVHPALLPSFPGVDGQRQALAAGVTITGCTVHLVDSGVDTGPILAQAAVPVLPTDDLAALGRRILEQEHRLLPGVVRAICEGRLAMAPRPHLTGFDGALAPLVSPPVGSAGGAS